MNAKARTRLAWLTAAQRFDWRIAPGEKPPPEPRVTIPPGAAHGMFKEPNR